MIEISSKAKILAKKLETENVPAVRKFQLQNRAPALDISSDEDQATEIRKAVDRKCQNHPKSILKKKENPEKMTFLQRQIMKRNKEQILYPNSSKTMIAARKEPYIPQTEKKIVARALPAYHKILDDILNKS